MIAPKELTIHDPGGLWGVARSLSPEQRLVQAMIEEACEDLFRVPCNANDTRAADAHEWIFGIPEGIKRWLFGDFESACHSVGVDPDALRDSLRMELRRRCDAA